MTVVLPLAEPAPRRDRTPVQRGLRGQHRLAKRLHHDPDTAPTVHPLPLQDS